jgi:beta-aspartyl-peptidase (threonine type)
VTAFALAAGLLLAASPAGSPVSEEAAVRAVLDEQSASWSRGDLDGYMAGYARSDAITFYAGGGVTRGWQATLDRYRTRYQAAGRPMGTLSFTDITVELLGPDAAIARGRWRLALAGHREAKGLFTLLFRKVAEGWRITHDHSSAE